MRASRIPVPSNFEHPILVNEKGEESKLLALSVSSQTLGRTLLRYNPRLLMHELLSSFAHYYRLHLRRPGG
jgi:hypothetical protein